MTSLFQVLKSQARQTLTMLAFEQCPIFVAQPRSSIRSTPDAHTYEFASPHRLIKPTDGMSSEVTWDDTNAAIRYSGHWWIGGVPQEYQQCVILYIRSYFMLKKERTGRHTARLRTGPHSHLPSPVRTYLSS